MASQKLVIYGCLFEGFTFYGPFESGEAASNFIDNAAFNDPESATIEDLVFPKTLEQLQAEDGDNQ